MSQKVAVPDQHYQRIKTKRLHMHLWGWDKWANDIFCNMMSNDALYIICIMMPLVQIITHFICEML